MGILGFQVDLKRKAIYTLPSLVVDIDEQI
jgi:hypothetical protein